MRFLNLYLFVNLGPLQCLNREAQFRIQAILLHHGDHLFAALFAADGAGDLVVVVVAQGLYPVDLYGLLLSLALGDGEYAVLIAVTDNVVDVLFFAAALQLLLKLTTVWP